VKIGTRPAALALSIFVMAAAAAALIYAKYFVSRSSRIDSIAVLPFVNATADPNAAYVSDGLTESLIDELARLPGLKVIARSSSFTYRGQDVDVQEVGRALRVGGVVIGRVEQRGGNLFVSAELVNVQDRSHLWGGQYTRQMSDIQQLQDEMARALAGKLQPGSSADQERQLSKRYTVNPQAYEFYLNGLFHFNQGGNDGIRKALEYCNEAVLLDPNFAVGWACVSRANNNLGGNSISNPKDTQVKAKAAAERALELDETLADAHLALGRIRQDEWDWGRAEQEYKRAIELSPSLASAHAEYAQFLSVMIRHTEALNEIKRAQELDPMSVRLKHREAWLLHLARRTDEGLAILLDTVKQAQPTVGPHYRLGFMYEAKGMYDEAIRQFQELIRVDGGTTGNLCYLAGSLALAGRKKEALEIVDKLNRSKEYVSPTELAAVHARLNDTEAALTHLEKAYAEHDLQLQILNVEPYFDRLRSDPRFQNLLRRVGLPSLPNG
jgi:TolB-like protein/tetratricopeptide (TPR) repeat protein